MRKLITFIVASLIPVGMWTAGCRQDNRQASFPNTAEMKGLAQAPAPNGNNPPRINPAPNKGNIDRDILNLPDSPAMARATAVNDKSRQMAKPKASDDLFGLPDTQPTMASIYDPRPADISPSQGGGEFWSRPTAGPANTRYGQAPADVSAMAPADNGPGFAGPPVKFTPPPASRKRSTGYADPMDVPGIFMDEPMSMRSGSPPAARQPLSEPFPGGDALGAPPPLTKRDIATKSEKYNSPRKFADDTTGPVRLDLSGLVTASKTSTVSAATESFTTLNDPVITAAYNPPSFVTPQPPMLVRAIPGDYEPLPEPIPLEQYLATLNTQKVDMPPPTMATPRRRGGITLPAATSSQTLRVASVPIRETPAKPARKTDGFLPLPELSALARTMPEQEAPMPIAVAAPKVGTGPAVMSSADIKKALAPLPDISGSTPVATARKADKKIDKIEKVDIQSITNIPTERPEPLTIPSLEQAGAKMDLSELAISADLELPEPMQAKPAKKKKTTQKTETKKNNVNTESKIKPKKIESKTESKAGAKTKAKTEMKAEAKVTELPLLDLPGLAIPELGLTELKTPLPPPPLFEAPQKAETDADTFAKAFLEELKQEAAVQAEISDQKAVSAEKIQTGELDKRDNLDKPVALNSEPPRKIRLQPIRKHRDTEMAKIDASMEVPPMRF